MVELTPPYRRATPGDAAALAELANEAGEGLPLYVWSTLAGGGDTPWDIGRERARRDSGAFTWRNAIVREEDGEVLACLIGYPLPENMQPLDYSDIPPLFVPLQRLEDQVPGSWYVNVLATRPAYRGKGYGRELLRLAEELAREQGCRGMSIIIVDTNEGARRLYERQGYVEKARLPVVKEGWRHPGREWVLLVKT